MIELTHFEKIGGPLTKEIRLDKDGKLVSDGSACVMSNGIARRARFQGLTDMAAFISDMPSHSAIALGRLREGLDGDLTLTTHTRLESLNGSAAPNMISRTATFIGYAAGEQAFALIDVDTKGMPQPVAERIEAVGGFWAALCEVMPALTTAARIVRNSTSSGLSRSDTGEAIRGSRGQHIYLAVRDGSDIERFLYALHDRCWLAGLGWYWVGAGGQLLDRSLIDRSVFAAERLVFEGNPVLNSPLQQDSAARAAIPFEGNILDTREICPSLLITETAELKKLKEKAAYGLSAERAAGRENFINARAQGLAAKKQVPIAAARRIIERQCEGVLRPDIELPFDRSELAGVTVLDVLESPALYAGETLADPLEGVIYGRGKAKIMRRPDGTPWINSFAHGRTEYALRYDLTAARDAIEAASEGEVTDIFVRLVLNGDLDAAEAEDLRNATAAKAGIGKRALNDKLKAAQKQKAARDHQDQNERRAAERQDTRPQLEAPLADAPWIPVMNALNEVMGASRLPEPPMRDADGLLTQVRVRRVPDLHVLTSVGVNEGQTPDTRLPAPEQALLTRLDDTAAAELIERNVDFCDDKGRSVHLGGGFVRHFRQRDDGMLPVVSALSSLPIVTVDGEMLCTPGLDRAHGIVFRLSREMLSLLPDPASITDARVAAAMNFLVNEWLCDVTTDYTGKATLIAAALTIIERALLPERPAFFVTAGRRGGGKTTALMMLMTAVTGLRPSAAAWSPNEEERRKSLVSYLQEGLAALIFDNIPRGAQIACPHIESALTSMTYTDRRLATNEITTVNSTTVLLFTGNNIGPKGDMASRSLKVHLEVDRADPENRAFTHPDPVGWTDANRGKILRALFVILVGNPNRIGSPETRFKTWWRLVGSAVENAARLHAETAGVDEHGTDADAASRSVAISFKDLFLTQEQDDEEGAVLIDALIALRAQSNWADRGFGAADVAKMLNDQSERGAQEIERAAILRDFLFPGSNPSLAATSISVGKRLKKHVGEPVKSGEQTFFLREEKSQKGGGRAASTYRIDVR